MKNGWQYVQTNGTAEKMAPMTLIENVKMSENGASMMQGVLDAFFPVGSIKFTTANVNPGTFMGGTWVAWGAGRTPVGVDFSDMDFDAAEEQGGEKKHTLTVNELPLHDHTVRLSYDGYIVGGNLDFQCGASTTLRFQKNGLYGGYGSTAGVGVTGDTGGGAAFNNLQPYITCFMWKRTA